MFEAIEKSLEIAEAKHDSSSNASLSFLRDYLRFLNKPGDASPGAAEVTVICIMMDVACKQGGPL